MNSPIPGEATGRVAAVGLFSVGVPDFGLGAGSCCAVTRELLNTAQHVSAAVTRTTWILAGREDMSWYDNP